ncbi:MAG: hypothetical protein RJB22_433 [Pseudomonadota bacterium]
MMRLHSFIATGVSLGLLATTQAAKAEQAPATGAPDAVVASAPYPAVRLLDTDKDVLGQAFVFPKGPTRLVSEIVTLAPGESGATHRHLFPMFAYLLEGSLMVDYGPQGQRSYKAGDALVEAMGVPHHGHNQGTEKVRILVVYMAEKDAVLVAR